MCGIVGLLAKDPSLEPELGALLARMLGPLSERGPDSTGMAVYRAPDEHRWRISLRRTQPSADWDDLLKTASEVSTLVEAPVAPSIAAVEDCAVLTIGTDPESFLPRFLEHAPEVDLLGYGRSVEIVKAVGSADAICERYGIAQRSGYQGIGHTRMATESAVTARHSHPFSPTGDLCLVHNGSFSNHATVRRRLERAGVMFDSDNDSEVAARLVAFRLGQGDDLEEAMRWVQKELDGFFTLLVTSATQFCVVRDAFACKPAAIAETDRYVAVASEYRALATLPGIEDAEIFEPAPEQIYAWSRTMPASPDRVPG